MYNALMSQNVYQTQRKFVNKHLQIHSHRSSPRRAAKADRLTSQTNNKSCDLKKFNNHLITCFTFFILILLINTNNISSNNLLLCVLLWFFLCLKNFHKIISPCWPKRNVTLSGSNWSSDLAPISYKFFLFLTFYHHQCKCAEKTRAQWCTCNITASHTHQTKNVMCFSRAARPIEVNTIEIWNPLTDRTGKPIHCDNISPWESKHVSL